MLYIRACYSIVYTYITSYTEDTLPLLLLVVVSGHVYSGAQPGALAHGAHQPLIISRMHYQ